MAYAIAKRFPVAERWTVAFTFPQGQNTDEHGCCPMGALLRELGWATWTVPVGSAIAQLLHDRGLISEADKHRVFQEAWEFLSDWDGDKITNLAEALGVEDRP